NVAKLGMRCAKQPALRVPLRAFVSHAMRASARPHRLQSTDAPACPAPLAFLDRTRCRLLCRQVAACHATRVGTRARVTDGALARRAPARRDAQYRVVFPGVESGSAYAIAARDAA